ncbi:MAG TPA: DUF1992 domain-containing protein [Candidatus Contendobacter sp.]|nr:DUF1992 domain-containing protein [Candidatus Contendobacter sp.]
MNTLDQIAEARIQEAMERGELRDLPGEGKPLSLDDDSAVPEELRVAYRVLKNAGFLPPELQLRKEVCEAEQLLQQLPESARSRARARLELLQLRLAASRRQPINLLLEDYYRQRLLERLDPAHRDAS